MWSSTVTYRMNENNRVLQVTMSDNGNLQTFHLPGNVAKAVTWAKFSIVSVHSVHNNAKVGFCTIEMFGM